MPQWCTRLLRGIVAVVVLVLLATVGSTLPASAHAGLAASDPVDGAVLESAPTTIKLQFNEPVGPVATAFGLYDPAGRHTVDGVPSQISVRAVDTVVTATLPPGLAPGSYLLSWRVVSADAHPVSGAVSFAVGAASTTLPQALSDDPDALGRAVPTLYLGLQVLGYLGLLAAVGLVVFGSFVLRGRIRPERSRLVVGAVVVAVVASLLLVGVTGLRERGAPLSDLLDAATWRSGATGPEGLGAALVVGGSALLLLAGQRGRWGQVCTVAGAVLALSSVLPTGHTRTTGPGWLMAGLDLVHVAAAAVWFGGLIGLGAYLVRSRRDAGTAVTAARTVARFSTLAGAVVGLLGLSGLLMAAIVVRSFRDLVGSDYGRALLVKLALVGLVGLLAVWTRRLLVSTVIRRPGDAARWRRLRSAVWDEAVIVVVAIGVTGLLTTLSPPVEAGPADDVAVGSSATVQRADLGTGSVQARLLPAGVGRNTLELTLRDGDGAPLASAEDPEVTASLPAEGLGPLPATVTKLPGTSRYRAEVPLPVEGSWRFLVSVQIDGFDNPTAVLVIPVRG